MSRSTHTYVAVVDDDENLCRSSGRLLRAAGLFPVSYPWAEAFLPDTERPYFDCLVLDVRLGGMSGIELRQRLNEMGPTSPLFSTQLTLILWTRSAPRKWLSGVLTQNGVRRTGLECDPPGNSA